jgi:hypothetical protein
MSKLIKLSLLAAFVTVTGSCKDKPAGEAKAAEAKRDGVELKKFVTDRMTAPDLEKIYPAGKTFQLDAVVKTAAKCEPDCSLEVGDGGKTSMQLTLDAANKAKLEAKKPGDTLVLSCTPVYEGGTLQIAKSCTVP